MDAETELDTGPKIKRTTSHTKDPSKTVPIINPIKSLPSVVPQPSTIGQSTDYDSVPTSEATEETLVKMSKPVKPEEIYNSLKCQYRKVCERFLQTLALPGII